jgi:hypothetical protein
MDLFLSGRAFKHRIPNKDAAMPTEIFAVDTPVVWRCAWQLWGSQKLRGKSLHPRPEERLPPTKAAAEAQRLQMKSRFGDNVICCVTPGFIAKTHSNETSWPPAEGTP